MRLAEMADYICTQVRKTDDDSIAACKSFLGRRDELIYNDQLWRDSIYQFSFGMNVTGLEVPPNINETAALGMYFLPDLADRILGLRTSDRELYPEPEELLYRSSLDQYAQTGDPVKFMVLNGVVAFDPGGGSFSVRCLDSSDTNVEVDVDYITLQHKRVSETISLTTALTNLTYQGYEIERLTKPATTGQVILSYPDITLTIAAEAVDTRFDPRRRIRVIPAPTEDTTFKALCKRRHIPMDKDDDEPSIRNSENLLISLATVDMLRRQRQYAKAELLMREAASLMSQLKAVEVAQESNNTRLIPEDTYEYWYDPTDKGWYS